MHELTHRFSGGGGGAISASSFQAILVAFLRRIRRPARSSKQNGGAA